MAFLGVITPLVSIKNLELNFWRIIFWIKVKIQSPKTSSAYEKQRGWASGGLFGFFVSRSPKDYIWIKKLKKKYFFKTTMKHSWIRQQIWHNKILKFQGSQTTRYYTLLARWTGPHCVKHIVFPQRMKSGPSLLAWLKKLVVQSILKWCVRMPFWPPDHPWPRKNSQKIRKNVRIKNPS